jgi:DNA-binding LytR/AlgR family response regulator
VLFTDINLPGGTDGTALARQARELRPELPVAYASGAIARLPPDAAVPGGTFIPKPYNPVRVCVMLGLLAAGRG